MKKFLKAALFATLFIRHLIGPMAATDTLAATSISAGATANLLDNGHAVVGTLGVEQSAGRLNLRPAIGLGTTSTTVTADLLARSSAGVYFGAGLFAENLDGESFTSTAVDSFVTVVRHDNGKHRGDKHKRDKKVVHTHSNTTVTVLNREWDLYPSLVVGAGTQRGLFGESRVIFGVEETIRGQFSLGVRF